LTSRFPIVRDGDLAAGPDSPLAAIRGCSGPSKAAELGAAAALAYFLAEMLQSLPRFKIAA
jgi:hypothetical protein